MSVLTEAIDFVRVLGPVQAVTVTGGTRELPSATQRRLVALLAVEPGRSVRGEAICEALGVAPSALRTTISRVRRTLGPDAIAGSQGRYRLAIPTDAARFSAALAAVDPRGGRIEALERALAIWSGPPFDEFAVEEWALPVVGRLLELHAAAVEDHAEELIVARRWTEAIARLQAHIPVNPLRDRPRGLLLHALAGAGRQADALQAFREYRSYLAREVGTEPSAEVRRLDRQIAAGWDGVEEAVGFRSPVTAGRGTEARLPLPADLPPSSPVVGRRRELAQLASDLALVSGAGSRTVVLEGEPGIGKTTLWGAFARGVARRGSATVLFGRCLEGSARPLEPLRAPLEHLVEHLPTDVLNAHVRRCEGHLARIVPRVAERVELSPTMSAIAAVTMSPGQAIERHLRFDAAADLIRRAAEIAPIAVLLDDLQWAEPTALALLRHLAGALAEAPVLWGLSARDTGERHARLLRATISELEYRPSRRIRLGGFTEDELAELTASLVPTGGGAVAHSVTARLRRETAGNPLYATHLVRHWADSGQLTGQTTLELVKDAWPAEVPAGLRDLLLSRVEGLGQDVLGILSTAAVLGTEFSEDVLLAMAETGERQVMDALDRAERARLIVDLDGSPGRMSFVHALVAAAMYSELPGRQRRRLHARAAQVLEQQPGGRAFDHAAALTRHCALGGLVADAVRWAGAAGDAAVGQLSTAEAARWYRTALDHAPMAKISGAERAELMVGLGSAQHQLGDPGALDTLAEAVTLARECGAITLAARAALATDRGFLRLGLVPAGQVALIEAALDDLPPGEGEARARLLALLAEALVTRPEEERRLALAREAVALADDNPDPTLLARIASSVLLALWGPLPEATELRAAIADRAIAAAEQSDDVLLHFSVHAAAYTVAIQLGEPAKATGSLDRLRAIAAERPTPHTEFTVTYFDAFVAAMEARFADAERLMRQAGNLAGALGAADGFAVFAGQAAVIAAIAGHRTDLPAEIAQAVETGPNRPSAQLAHAVIAASSGTRQLASDFLDAAIASGFRGVPRDVMWMTAMLGYAKLAIELEDLDAAEQLLDIIEPHAGEVATSLGPVSAYAGRLASLLGRHEQGDCHLQAAIALVDAFGWNYHRTGIRSFLSSARRRAGRPSEQVLAPLREAEEIASACGLSGLLDADQRMRGEAQVKRS